MRPLAPSRKPLPTSTVADPLVDQHLREHRDALDDVRARSIVNAVLLAGNSLADGVSTPIRHGLGRRPSSVLVTPPYGDPASTGRTTIIARDDTFVTVEANGWGGTVIVDLVVLP